MNQNQQEKHREKGLAFDVLPLKCWDSPHVLISTESLHIELWGAVARWITSQNSSYSSCLNMRTKVEQGCKFHYFHSEVLECH